MAVRVRVCAFEKYMSKCINESENMYKYWCVYVCVCKYLKELVSTSVRLASLTRH